MNPAESSGTSCRQLIYQGRVQGVGFRATVHRIARRYPVAGYVRNCDDGTVEVKVEGEPASIDGFDAAIRAAFQRNIQDVVTRELPCSNEFSRFEIRR